MIIYKDCPECGARRIHSTVRLCEVCETCEKYESKFNAQWADLERIASLCGRTADEHPLQAVARVVRERDEARAEVERLRARVRSVDRSTAYEGSAFERDDELAEIEMLRGVGCREQKVDEPESGPCGACLRCAEERGARWALERHGNPFAEKTLAQYAEEICRDARGK